MGVCSFGVTDRLSVQMKARKSLPHAKLIEELYAQLKFPVQVTNTAQCCWWWWWWVTCFPQASDLKKRIESLLEREYLEFADENESAYNYLA